MIILKQPKNGAVVSQLTAYQKQFFENPAFYAKNFNEKMALGVEEEGGTDPDAVVFAWEGDEISEFQLSEDAEFSRVVYRMTGGSHCEISGLLLGKTYYWRVGDSEIFSFVTENRPPRLLHTESTFNMRDIGGRKNLQGAYVKQGMVYRGCQVQTLSPQGNSYLHDFLGVRCELDLRASSEGAGERSTIGEDVAYRLVSCGQYGGFVENKEQCRTIFSILADPQSYPLYLHCIYGADRTGTVCFLLEAVLGFSEEQILVDYETTSLLGIWTHNRDSGEMMSLYEALQPFGATLHERVENYLYACGITKGELETIRRLLLQS